MPPLRGNRKMDLDSIKNAICRGKIPLIHQFVNNKAILKRFVNGDPRAFYEILSSAINVERRWLRFDDVDKIYDDLILQLIGAAKEVHFGLFDGQTLLMSALRKRMSYEIIEELLKAGSDINAASYYMTPLLYAFKEKYDINIIAELISRGADISCRDHNGWTPLFHGMSDHYANPDFIRMLLNAGSNVHEIDNYGRNVLMTYSCYCLNGSDCKAKESIDLLQKYGLGDLDFKHTDNDGNTVLHKTFCKYVFELAMKSDVSIKAKNNKGRTPLLSNRYYFNEEKLVYLLKCGANIHSTDSKLQTVLHVYISDRFVPMKPSTLDMLIYHGGNMHSRNINNQTPLDAIIRRRQMIHYLNIVDFLADELVYVIPKHVILYDDNGFDMARNSLENLNDRVSVDSFLSACEKELKVMRETFIKDGLTFYEFCILKRYYKSKCVNIAPNEYKYSFSDISKLFPLYKNITIIRVKDNRVKKRDLDIRRVFERIVLRPVNTTGTDYSEVLNYYCLYHISKDLNFKEMFNVFSAAVES